MFNKDNDIFKSAYFTDLHLIKEDADVEEMGETAETDNTAEQTAENKLQEVKFLTSDPALIDALNAGFEEVVFFVKTTNEDGEESVEEVKFTGDSFGDFEISEVEEDSEDDEEPAEECGDNKSDSDNVIQEEETEEEPEEPEEVEESKETVNDDEVANECIKAFAPPHGSKYGPY